MNVPSKLSGDIGSATSTVLLGAIAGLVVGCAVVGVAFLLLRSRSGGQRRWLALQGQDDGYDGSSARLPVGGPVVASSRGAPFGGDEGGFVSRNGQPFSTNRDAEYRLVRPSAQPKPLSSHPAATFTLDGEGDEYNHSRDLASATLVKTRTGNAVQRRLWIRHLWKWFLLVVQTQMLTC